MLEGKNILVIGARIGGYGASIARSAVTAGARVFGTTLNPNDAREAAFFQQLGVELIDVPLKFDFDGRKRVFDEFALIEKWFAARQVPRLDAVVYAVAGGFPRQPSVMKAVGEILKGNQVFQDLATAVKRNVYYVNAGSFEDTIKGLSSVTDDETLFAALTYRGDLPYFIAPTKKFLERSAARLARKGKKTLLAALPEAWTQSSQFFTGIETAILHNYLLELKDKTALSEDLARPFAEMKRSLNYLEGFDRLLEQWPHLVGDRWVKVTSSADPKTLYGFVQGLFQGMRADGTFPVLRRAVEIVSDYVREACGIIFVREFIAGRRYEPGDVRQVFFRDLLQGTSIGKARPRESAAERPCLKRQWQVFERDEVRSILSMYGENFIFLDRVIMEAGDLHRGFQGFGCFTVPSPEKNPILEDHFVNMPLFGGHLQMEAVAQLGTFMMLKLAKDKRLVPILTGTEFPDLNTMAPPGEKLTIMGVIRLPEKRNLTLDAVIENRFARSVGVVRGMMINARLVRKMMTSFTVDDPED